MVFDDDTTMRVDEGLRQFSRYQAAQLLLGSRALHQDAPLLYDKPFVARFRLKVGSMVLLLCSEYKAPISRYGLRPN